MKKKEATAIATTKKRKRNNAEINKEKEISNPAKNQQCKTQ